MEEEIVFIAHIKKEPPAPEWPRMARNSVSDSDSGTGRSSRETESHRLLEDVELEEDLDLQIIKAAKVYPEFSLKIFGRQKQIADIDGRRNEGPAVVGMSQGTTNNVTRRKSGDHFPRYDQLGTSGLLSDDNWVRKEPTKVQKAGNEAKMQRAPPSRFRLPDGRLKKTRKILPEFHGCTNFSVQDVTLFSEVFHPEVDDEKPTSWFERNLVDMGRSVSAPPFIQPNSLRLSPTPSNSDDEMEIVEAVVHSGRVSRGEELWKSNSVGNEETPSGEAEKTSTVGFRGLATTVTVAQMEAVCAQNRIDWVGQIRLGMEPNGLEQFAEIDFFDQKYAEKLARFCDGRQLQGVGNRIRCFVKGATSPGFKSDYQWNCGKNRKRSWTESTLTHEELNRQLEEYKKNGVRELTERERMNPTRH